MNKFKNLLNKIFSGKRGYFVTLAIFLVFMYSFSFLAANNMQFKALNSERKVLGMGQYQDGNIFVKNKTLDQMQEDIDQRLEALFGKYILMFNPSQEHQNQIKTIYENSELSIEDKSEQIEKIMKGDILATIKQKSDDLEKLFNKNLQYNSDESNAINADQNSFEKINFTEDNTLEELINIYRQIEQLEDDVKTIQDQTNTRITNEQKAEDEKKAEEEQKAKNSDEDSAETKKTSNNSKSDTDSPDPKMDGNFDRASAAAIASAINDYRASLGLSPYAINSSEQSCTDSEAKAYAQTQNPHNWVCKDADNENASYTAIGSDMVNITMDFFINDPPHEAPMSGNYNSIAVSVYQSDGMNYTIVDFFY